MTRQVWLMGFAAVIVGMSLLLVSQTSAQASKKNAAALDKIAEAIKKGDKKAPEKMSEKLVKKLDYLEDAMNYFRPRNRGGFGVGEPGKVFPDGIERKLLIIARDAPTSATLKKELDAYKEMGYRIAAIAEVTKAWAVKDKRILFRGRKKKEDWDKWTKDMYDGALELTKAKSPAGVQKAAKSLNASCNACHSVFRQ